MQAERAGATLAGMTRTAAETRGGTSVLVAGGGVAALETALALRALGPGRVHVELVAPELHFFYKPLAVAEPFGVGRVHRWELDDLVRAAGADFVPGELVAVDPDARVAELKNGLRIGYDALVLATGARPEVAVRGALTFRGPSGRRGDPASPCRDRRRGGDEDRLRGAQRRRLAAPALRARVSDSRRARAARGRRRR